MEHFIPKKQLTIYEANYDNYYIEISDIEIKKNQAFISPPRPVRKETMLGLAKAFAVQELDIINFQSIIPENVLYFSNNLGSTKLIWYSKPALKSLFFTDKLHIKDGTANVPGLIFYVWNKELKVFAVKQKPNLKTQLYKAPFHNVSDDGKVCLGSVKITEKFKYAEDIIKAYETAFWNSKFSETHGTPVKGNINTLWKELINSKDKFPLTSLIKSNFKLSNLINE